MEEQLSDDRKKERTTATLNNSKEGRNLEKNEERNIRRKGWNLNDGIFGFS